ncbi:MAG: cyclic lactone autoinducer peptide [Ruminococcus sp.]|nr:cyclic lactone autoinducer peptide [Ruminococcus sp.]
MTEKLSKIADKVGKAAAAVAEAAAAATANQACMWLTYQPKEPDEIKALKKA